MVRSLAGMASRRRAAARRPIGGSIDCSQEKPEWGIAAQSALAW
ncbi:hypothetical protein I603_1037 [Erythrobacter dokdonensis DSW-74]|uniref:Uncharacterized protein n=1 Tax=Erythrobacter dokdonensis DSW-74 TaxID=1300349 RepID=A0A1A7BGH5_9SPHN|nr:hypothetical protein I603_1037 [Erythrobacter dokdonensis DSW-74]